VLDRLDQGRTSKGALAGFVPVIDSDFEKASLRIVMRQSFWLGYGDFRELLFQHFPDTCMQGLTLAA
jgi:hypothetical protein